MTAPYLCIVGNFSATCHVGSMLGRAADSLGIHWLPADLDYAPSVKTLVGKAFMRFSGGRPLEWWRFNRTAAAAIRRARPKLVVTTGVVPLQFDFFSACHEVGARICNFATDDPWADHMRSGTWFRRTIPAYDLIACTKTRVVDDFRTHGARRVKCVTYAYDPSLHRRPDLGGDEERNQYACDLSFIGTGNPERRAELEFVADRLPGTHHLYGNDWVRHRPRGWVLRGEANDNRFRLAAHVSQVSIALLRRGARDDATMRTFELAPCDSCGLYEDTGEHRQIFQGYPDCGFFRNLPELVTRCRDLLASPEKQALLRREGMRIIAIPENTYVARLQSILGWIGIS
jgi:spore maturation protein CgeB